jgi:hypothetical protein
MQFCFNYTKNVELVTFLKNDITRTETHTGDTLRSIVAAHPTRVLVTVLLATRWADLSFRELAATEMSLVNCTETA